MGYISGPLALHPAAFWNLRGIQSLEEVWHFVLRQVRARTTKKCCMKARTIPRTCEGPPFLAIFQALCAALAVLSNVVVMGGFGYATEYGSHPSSCESSKHTPGSTFATRVLWELPIAATCQFLVLEISYSPRLLSDP